ncbi:release factor glutamine methyltransferase [Lentzea sp. NBRC 105346]|uniref:peptide chain release factor N(5)-glutamine methyltransferase n=1 Tax=Lentzea sp. NBRC 105346 TaxID=3032205 RepID=UPI0024A0DF9C|nr:peptide chain release factor N(5)-glutamine methyltransferase [Lentzea sp. NBRC 105346]GLZ30189.1 release factor glutamine methyltransferase [Lentzea sp. NBRC 105346]
MISSRQPLRLAILEAERMLSAAGVDSPRVDAELLAAHVLGVERGRLPLIPLVDPPVIEALHKLVRRRALREPLQHITGWSAMGAISVSVGPGVFVPRPETELLFEWALSVLPDAPPVIIDLCTGSGVLALSLANARPDARVYAVERSSSALSWARRNADERRAAGDTPISLLSGDACDPTLLSDLDGSVDLVVCNPPYVPEGTDVQPEVGVHDPHEAVFSGADGLDVIRCVVSAAARWLRPGGYVGIEHDDTHGSSVPSLLAARRVLTDVQGHKDLAGRPRFATARKA